MSVSGLGNDELRALIGILARGLDQHVTGNRALAAAFGDGPVTKQSIRARIARLSIIAEALTDGEEPKS